MGLQKNCCPRRRWGKTELSIPVIPFGTQGFGGHFGPVDDEQAMALMRRAVDLGVNHFDCARCYGDSLHKLGRAIKEASSPAARSSSAAAYAATVPLNGVATARDGPTIRRRGPWPMPKIS